jgi:hypothetical protein
MRKTNQPTSARPHRRLPGGRARGAGGLGRGPCARPALVRRHVPGKGNDDA